MTYPRPRPATYEAVAGMDGKASLLGLLDAIFDVQSPAGSVVVTQSKALLSHVTLLSLSHVGYYAKSSWPIKELGVSIIGGVCELLLS